MSRRSLGLALCRPVVRNGAGKAFAMAGAREKRIGGLGQRLARLRHAMIQWDD